jgi:hypothetical protein
MGQANTNVEQHVCSKCRNVRPLADFLYPKEVWWCSSCWAAFRAKQKETRRQRNEENLKTWAAKPRAQAWRVACCKSKHVISTLSGWQQFQVWDEYKRLIVKATRGGSRQLTRQKRASLLGNAIFVVKYVRTGKVLGWMGNYWKRLKRLRLLEQKQQLEELKARPIGQRHKYLDIG